MLSTSNITLNAVSPVIGPGNHTVKINSMVYNPAPYDQEVIIITFNLETMPIGNNFNGFLVDPNNTNGERYKGQVGRVKLNPYGFKTMKFANGQEIQRDVEILKYISIVADATNLRDKLDLIEAPNIFSFLDSCKSLFVNTAFFNACIGGKEYKNLQNYINIDLHFPKLSTKSLFMTKLDNSNVLQYDASKHLKKLVENKQEEFEM